MEQRFMKKYDVSELLLEQLTNGKLDLSDEMMVVKIFQFCNDNEIEPIYQKLESECEDFTLLKLIDRTISNVNNDIPPKNCLSEDLMTKILNGAE